MSKPQDAEFLRQLKRYCFENNIFVDLSNDDKLNEIFAAFSGPNNNFQLLKDINKLQEFAEGDGLYVYRQGETIPRLLMWNERTKSIVSSAPIDQIKEPKAPSFFHRWMHRWFGRYKKEINKYNQEKETYDTIKTKLGEKTEKIKQYSQKRRDSFDQNRTLQSDFRALQNNRIDDPHYDTRKNGIKKKMDEAFSNAEKSFSPGNGLDRFSYICVDGKPFYQLLLETYPTIQKEKNLTMDYATFLKNPKGKKAADELLYTVVKEHRQVVCYAPDENMEIRNGVVLSKRERFENDDHHNKISQGEDETKTLLAKKAVFDNFNRMNPSNQASVFFADWEEKNKIKANDYLQGDHSPFGLQMYLTEAKEAFMIAFLLKKFHEEGLISDANSVTEEQLRFIFDPTRMKEKKAELGNEFMEQFGKSKEDIGKFVSELSFFSSQYLRTYYDRKYKEVDVSDPNSLFTQNNVVFGLMGRLTHAQCRSMSSPKPIMETIRGKEWKDKWNIEYERSYHPCNVIADSFNQGNKCACIALGDYSSFARGRTNPTMAIIMGSFLGKKAFREFHANQKLEYTDYANKSISKSMLINPEALGQEVVYRNAALMKQIKKDPMTTFRNLIEKKLDDAGLGLIKVNDVSGEKISYTPPEENLPIQNNKQMNPKEHANSRIDQINQSQADFQDEQNKRTDVSLSENPELKKAFSPIEAKYAPGQNIDRYSYILVDGKPFWQLLKEAYPTMQELDDKKKLPKEYTTFANSLHKDLEQRKKIAEEILAIAINEQREVVFYPPDENMKLGQRHILSKRKREDNNHNLEQIRKEEEESKKLLEKLTVFDNYNRMNPSRQAGVFFGEWEKENNTTVNKYFTGEKKPPHLSLQNDEEKESIFVGFMLKKLHDEKKLSDAENITDEELRKLFDPSEMKEQKAKWGKELIKQLQKPKNEFEEWLADMNLFSAKFASTYVDRKMKDIDLSDPNSFFTHENILCPILGRLMHTQARAIKNITPTMTSIKGEDWVKNQWKPEYNKAFEPLAAIGEFFKAGDSCIRVSVGDYSQFQRNTTILHDLGCFVAMSKINELNKNKETTLTYSAKMTKIQDAPLFSAPSLGPMFITYHPELKKIINKNPIETSRQFLRGNVNEAGLGTFKILDDHGLLLDYTPPKDTISTQKDKQKKPVPLQKENKALATGLLPH